MGKDTVYRIEERKHPHKPVIDFINDVFNPSEKVDKLISEFWNPSVVTCLNLIKGRIYHSIRSFTGWLG
jgi:hypothetical protein